MKESTALNRLIEYLSGINRIHPISGKITIDCKKPETLVELSNRFGKEIIVSEETSLPLIYFTIHLEPTLEIDVVSSNINITKSVTWSPI